MKRILAIIFSVLMLLSLLTACGSSANVQDEWAKVVIGNKFPTPQKGKLRIGSNLDDLFMGDIEKVDESYFLEYKDACKELGYTIDSEESGSSYTAFNEEAYKVSLYYYSKKLSITLEAPDELSKLVWPETGMAAYLPAPKSDLTKVVYDTANTYEIIVGETTREVFNEYVSTCEQAGFIVDHSKQEDYYQAENAEGYRLAIRYIGCNRMRVTIQSPKEKEETTLNTTVGEQENTKPSGETSTAGISKDFKNAMDSYEKFMDEYVAFMKKYQANPTDFGLLMDYTNYMTDYAKFVEDFAKWEDAEMNDAELAYYIDVQARVSKKLLEVAG